ncbi:MAG: hypothetical protein K2O32_11140 [Acetatifactor sp.]|nr:hypothetical protein [Acetatifactor sp.]
MSGYWQWLEEKELLDESHMPVLLVLNMIREEKFLETLEAVSQGTGFGAEFGACIMPDDLDEFDKANGEEFDGVEFGTHDGDEVVIDYSTFYYYLCIICNHYLRWNVDKTDIVKGYLLDYYNRFTLTESNNEIKNS